MQRIRLSPNQDKPHAISAMIVDSNGKDAYDKIV